MAAAPRARQEEELLRLAIAARIFVVDEKNAPESGRQSRIVSLAGAFLVTEIRDEVIVDGGRARRARTFIVGPL